MASVENQTAIKQSKRGGARAGAGRKPKSLPQNASYEGAWRYNSQRAWIYTSGLDAKKDLTSGSRTELIRKANWMVNNIGLAGGAVDKIARLAGPLKPQARTSDSAWNKKAEQAFSDAVTWAPGVDVSAYCNFFQAQSVLVRQMAIAGDVFWQNAMSANGRAMFRLIPGENVGSADGTEDDGWYDGVKINEFGRPIKIRVLKRPGASTSDEYQDIDADKIRQVNRRYRIGYTRAPSWFARACNHLQDYSEYLGYEKTSAKLGAQLGVVITSPDPGVIGLGSGALTQSATSGAPLSIDSMTNSSMIPQLKSGEKIESFINNHPAGNFSEFIKVLARDIAVGFGVSPEFLFDMDVGGAGVRWVLEEASIFIKEVQDIIATDFATPFYKYWVWNEIESGRLEMPGDGTDWWRVEWVNTQGDLSVDFGRDGRLMSDLLLRGHISPQRYFGLQGLDSDKQDEDIIRSAARRKKMVQEIAKEEGVELTTQEAFPPAPGSSPPPDTQEEEEPTPTPSKPSKD